MLGPGGTRHAESRPGLDGTDQRNGVSFDPVEGSAVGGWTGCDEFGAYSNVARHAVKCAEWHRTQDVARRSLAWTGWPGVRASTTRAATGWPGRQVEAPREEQPADSGPEPPGQREPTDQGTDRLNGLASGPDLLKDGLDIPPTDAD
jgi:hypothetical protein